MHYTFIAHCVCSAAQTAVSHVSPSLSPSQLQAGHLSEFAASVFCGLLQSLCRKGTLALLASFIFAGVTAFSAIDVVAVVMWSSSRISNTTDSLRDHFL